jgi:hypothetical protein
MEDVHHSLETLFAQLGLENNGEAIDRFIDNHQLAADEKMTEADFWSDSQKSLLNEALGADGEQAMWVDELNVRLHHNANQAAN